MNPRHSNCQVCADIDEADEHDAELELAAARGHRHVYIEATGTSGAVLLICRECGHPASEAMQMSIREGTHD